jgi:hypothetical protein
MTEVTIRGDKELFAKLNKLQPRKQKVAMKAMGLHLVGKMKVYPPQQSTTYARTRNLAKRWDTRAKEQEVKVQNFAHYAPYVQGERQAAWHTRTGWQTLKDTAIKNSEEMVKLLKANIDRILERG